MFFFSPYPNAFQGWVQVKSSLLLYMPFLHWSSSLSQSWSCCRSSPSPSTVHRWITTTLWEHLESQQTSSNPTDNSDQSKFVFFLVADHHPVEQWEASSQSEQMASNACSSNCDRRQEEGEDWHWLRLTLTLTPTHVWLTTSQMLTLTLCQKDVFQRHFLSFSGQIYLYHYIFSAFMFSFSFWKMYTISNFFFALAFLSLGWALASFLFGIFSWATFPANS